MRPGPGSKRSPMPWLTSSSTRAFGIFTTNSACGVIIAKILPFTFSAPEPKPCRDSRVTSRLPATVATTGANRGSSVRFSRFEDPAIAFLRRFDMVERRHCSAASTAPRDTLVRTRGGRDGGDEGAKPRRMFGECPPRRDGRVVDGGGLESQVGLGGAPAPPNPPQ